MRLLALCIAVLISALAIDPAMAMGGLYGKGDTSTTEDPMPGPSEMTPLDEKEGKGSSDRLAAQGTVRYDTNTGMMNVVPSDFTGNIQD